jgi:hypothetical protein
MPEYAKKENVISFLRIWASELENKIKDDNKYALVCN